MDLLPFHLIRLSLAPSSLLFFVFFFSPSSPSSSSSSSSHAVSLPRPLIRSVCLASYLSTLLSVPPRFAHFRPSPWLLEYLCDDRLSVWPVDEDQQGCTIQISGKKLVGMPKKGKIKTERGACPTLYSADRFQRVYRLGPIQPAVNEFDDSNIRFHVPAPGRTCAASRTLSDHL